MKYLDFFEILTNKSFYFLCINTLKRAITKKKFSAFIDLTARCNLNCRNCYYKRFIDTGEVPLYEWKKRFSSYKKRGISQVTFIGGEPSLRMPVLFEAEKYFPIISVFTNGVIKIPKKFNHRIVLSLDGMKKNNDKLRGKGVFDKAASNYMNDKRVVISVTLSKHNYRDVNAMINLSEKLNVNGIVFGLYTPRKNEDDKHLLSVNQKRYISKILNKAIENKNRYLLMTKSIVHSLLFKEKNKKTCRMFNRHYSIDINNDYKTCFAVDNDCRRCGCILSANPDDFRDTLNNLAVMYRAGYELPK